MNCNHFLGLEIARDISKGKLDNAVENSIEVTFRPGQLTPGHYIGDTKTAGYVKLIKFVSHTNRINV